MGSYLARCYVIENSRDLAGIVLSATGGDPGWLGKVGPLVARTEARLRGGRHVSTLLQGLLNGPYNGAFKPNRTYFDWLSRDEAEVDKYVADELCGRTATSSFFVDLGTGVAQSNDRRQVARVRRDLPILIVSGERDPSGHNGTGPPGGRASSTPRSASPTSPARSTRAPARDLQRDQPRRGHRRPHRWLDAHLPRP